MTGQSGGTLSLTFLYGACDNLVTPKGAVYKSGGGSTQEKKEEQLSGVGQAGE